MSSAFIYQPHVRQSDGTIVTPDIAIERVFASGPDKLAPVPVSRLISSAVRQQTEETPVGAPAVVLAAASYGMLISVGVIYSDSLWVAREAWRYDDIRDGYDDVRLRSWIVRNGGREVFVSGRLGALVSPANALQELGNPSGLRPGAMVFLGHTARFGECIPATRFEIALEASGRYLRCGFGLEKIG
tara:strand:- start:128 stop:688 length:561 start_codon:yes stop_codon:yes gene_type:complete